MRLLGAIVDFFRAPRFPYEGPANHRLARLNLLWYSGSALMVTWLLVNLLSLWFEAGRTEAFVGMVMACLWMRVATALHRWEFGRIRKVWKDEEARALLGVFSSRTGSRT